MNDNEAIRRGAKREFWWIVSTIAVLLVLTAAVQIALPFLSALAANS
ncbi:hypothetical protein [Promicromonospora sp. NPDC023987]